jgi:hypothetical protein
MAFSILIIFVDDNQGTVTAQVAAAVLPPLNNSTEVHAFPRTTPPLLLLVD